MTTEEQIEQAVSEQATADVALILEERVRSHNDGYRAGYADAMRFFRRFLSWHPRRAALVREFREYSARESRRHLAAAEALNEDIPF